MNVERQGKTAIIAATIASAHQHGFTVIISEKPSSTAPSEEQS